MSLPSTSNFESHTFEQDEDGASTIREPSIHFSDDEQSDSDEREHTGDYSMHMEELFGDGEDELDALDGELDEDDEGGFLYTGVDAELSSGYRDQLREVLGPDLVEEDDEKGEKEAEEMHDTDLSFNDDEPLDDGVHSEQSSSSSLVGEKSTMTPLKVDTPTNGTPNLSRPFLHPNVSRLRSYIPQKSGIPSNGSTGTLHSHLFDGSSRSPSHFSAMSRISSLSNLRTPSSGGPQAFPKGHTREVFRWTELRDIKQHIYPTSRKAALLLGFLGSPTVLAANGLICVGTDEGKICVYDFKQALKCICGNDVTAKTIGAVTALALSHDHTYVASGHSSGHIQLYDLKKPQSPVRSVVPVTLAGISSGRREGHLSGSRIVSVGFIAGRHTAIVTADEHGLAFYHSLGKVLFVEAPDILRILGKYPQEGISPAPVPSRNASSPAPNSSLPARHKRTRYTVLAMSPLPLGTSPHATDSYNVIALLTPTKLVVVGLKPTPRTWFKCPRAVDEGGSWKSNSKWTGTLAWFPSMLPVHSNSEWNKDSIGPNHQEQTTVPTSPMLVYTWGSVLHLVRVFEFRTKQITRNTRTGKANNVDVGRIAYEDVDKWSADDDILAAQWLNANQVVVLTLMTLQVYDLYTSSVVEQVQFDGLSLVSPSLSGTTNGAISYSESVSEVSHSVRVYKGKIFLLGRDQIQVGTLLTWADRILHHVQDGDFLSAIDLTRSYYVGDASGNMSGLPTDPDLRKEVVGEKIQELMVASSQYAFSEDRMSDGTHITPDGRGVDRTSLFEGLVTTCCRACVALNDFDFLFEDLFQQYDDTGISRIYLLQLEPFILNSEIQNVPPRITQRLVALHEEDGRSDHVERIIWHIDPTCLDINQTIQICQRHHLYDALIYIYTRALRDYVAPVVALLGLIRSIQQYRKSRVESSEPNEAASTLDLSMEPIILNAYKIYPYLANILSGLTYPSEEPLSEDEAFQAKRDVYTFLFFGRSSVWPPGDEAKLVLTSDEEGGVEPTYPYARLLLRFDSESFLHSLDIAFEDPYLNDESQGVSRLVVVRILLEILSSGNLPSMDVTFVNIFIARNVPKYPQFLQLSPNALHSILIGLANDADESTREDRQLAAEYLLSVYNPHESDRIIHLFEIAGFYRILRAWYRQDQRWAPWLTTYLDDTQLHPSEVFQNVDEVLVISARANNGSLLPALVTTIADALPQLLQASIASTALLVDKHVPQLHERALEDLGPNADYNKFLYLRHLMGSPQPEEDEYVSPPPKPSLSLSVELRHQYISLHCRFHPSEVIETLKHLPSDLAVDWDQILHICEVNAVYDACVWATNWKGDPRDALSKAETFHKRLTSKIVDDLTAQSQTLSTLVDDIDRTIASLEALSRTGIAVCLEHSRRTSTVEVPLEDIWFQLLSCQIHCVQTMSECCAEDISPDTAKLTVFAETRAQTVSALRSLVQETFEALVSVSSTRAVSFPRLFKRLVSSAPTSTGTQYTEFRIVLTGMLESYRSEGDMLIITKHLVDRDLYDIVAEVTRERARGWNSSRGTCSFCRLPLLDKTKPDSTFTSKVTTTPIVVSRTGTIYHSECLPQEA